MTISITAATARPIHGAIVYAASPATESTRKISSGAYATDDRAWEANTGSAIRLGSKVCANVSLRNGRPRNSRRVAVDSFDTSTNPMRSGGVAVALCGQFPRVAAALHRKGSTLRVVVMGCGRVGASLADALARIGHEVAVIDRDATAFNRLSPGSPGGRGPGLGFARAGWCPPGIGEAALLPRCRPGTTPTSSRRG